MDRLFMDGASGRRRFLDRLVFAFDPEHSTRVNGYEHAWRERNRLICEGVRDPAWFAALEETLATTGVAVAAARRSEEHTSELQSLMRISYAVLCLKNTKKQT